MTPELAYEKRFAAIDNGAHTWAAAPQHVKDMWLAAWTISEAVNSEDERERLRALVGAMWDEYKAAHPSYRTDYQEGYLDALDAAEQRLRGRA